MHPAGAATFLIKDLANWEATLRPSAELCWPSCAYSRPGQFPCTQGHLQYLARRGRYVRNAGEPVTVIDTFGVLNPRTTSVFLFRVGKLLFC